MKSFNRCIALLSIIIAFQAQAQNFFDVSLSGLALTVRSTVPNHTYPSAGIKIQSQGYELTGIGTECQNAGNGYCVFSVSDTQPTTLSLRAQAGDLKVTLCLDGKGPLTCQEYNHLHVQLAYVTQPFLGTSGMISVCPVQANGTFGPCQDAGGGSEFVYGPEALVFNAAQTLAYIDNWGSSSLSVCPVKSTGVFGSCLQSFPYFQDHGGIVLTPNESALLVTDWSLNQVSRCPLNADGTIASCTPTGSGFYNPFGIALNSAGTLAYVVNNSPSGSISVCEASDGTLSNCVDSGAFGVGFDYPSGIVLNNAQTLAYIANSNGTTVTVCPIIAGGLLGSCFDAGYDSFNLAWGIALNKDNTYAYVSNYNGNSVTVCTILTNGTFGSCVDSTQPFPGQPVGMAILE